MDEAHVYRPTTLTRKPNEGNGGLWLGLQGQVSRTGLSGLQLTAWTPGHTTKSPWRLSSSV